MAIDIVPSSFWRFPIAPGFWDDSDDMPLTAQGPSGISISEDEQHVYVEVALPGIKPEEIEITFDKGILWVKGEAKEEENKRKYYRKATRSFSYRVAVPGDLDGSFEPEATSTNGVMSVKFKKSPKAQPKKITVKA